MRRQSLAVAEIWLETMEIECASKVFAERVRAVVDRSAETVAPFWAKHNNLKHVQRFNEGD